MTAAIKLKRKAKDSVFLDLFGNKRYLLELYRTLHPEDADVTEDMLDLVTLNNVLTDNLYNDLGVMVRDDQLLLLVEAQSTWSVNVLIRILQYLAETYRIFFESTSQSLYRSRKVRMPRPELYVIYTGYGQRPASISLKDEFFDSLDADIEIKAKVISDTSGHDIISQYIVFCKVFDEHRKKCETAEEAIRETLRICKDRDILRDYLKTREREVVTMMSSLFDEEAILKTYVEDVVNEAVDEAVKQTEIDVAKRLIRAGQLSLNEIADAAPTLSRQKLRDLWAEAGRPM